MRRLTLGLLVALSVLVAGPAGAQTSTTVERTPPYDFGESDGSLVAAGAAGPCGTLTYSFPPSPGNTRCGGVTSTSAGVYVDTDVVTRMTARAVFRNTSLLATGGLTAWPLACIGYRPPDGNITFTTVDWCAPLPGVGEEVVVETSFPGSSFGEDGFSVGRHEFVALLRDRGDERVAVWTPTSAQVERISVVLTPLG